MKQEDVLGVGHTYIVKVSGHLVPVKLTAISPYGGWVGRSEKTGREVRIRSAAKLRRVYTPDPEKVKCSCSHAKFEHATQPSGAVACKHFRCGCSDFDKVS